MNSLIEVVVSWLAEVYLLSTIILTLAFLASVMLRQPARRLVVAKSALVSLVALAPIAAGAQGARSWWREQKAPAIAISRPSPSQSASSVCSCSSAVPVSSLPVDSTRWNSFDFLSPSSGRAVIQPAAVFATFVVGSGAMLAWLGLGAIASARLTARTDSAADRLAVILNRVVGKGVRLPRLLISSRVPHPVAVGLIRPSIILPARFAEVETEGRIEAALAHEWAHIRHGDLWLLALSRLLLPLLFAHPMYVMLRRQLRADQEALADASAAGIDGRISYAEALLAWSRAEAWPTANTFATALGLWGRGSSLASRIALLLDRDFRIETRCPRYWQIGVRAVTAGLLIGLGLALMAGSESIDPWPPSATCTIARGIPHVHNVSSSSQMSLETYSATDVRCQ